MSSALIVVDVQNDFCEGGKLAVAGGAAVAADIANYIQTQGKQYRVIVFTKDWHEPWPSTNGGHFAVEPDFVDSWPVHCVLNTWGADFHPALASVVWEQDPSFAYHHSVFYKGTGKPDYSGFQGSNHINQSLDTYLKMHGVDAVDICGIAGDYCVKQTALDAKKNGYEVNFLPKLIASVGGRQATMDAISEVFELPSLEK